MRLEVTLTKTVGDFELDVDFSSDADFIVVHGPSGAGKSILLKTIAGLMAPDGGRIAVGGRVLFDSAGGVSLPSRERLTGYVAQDYSLFPHMNVEKNVTYGLKRGLFGGAGSDEEKWVEQLLEAFGLEKRRKHSISTLSGGQRQRVALARAVAAKSQILLLDEPFSALDEPLRRHMRGELRSIQKLFGVQVVMVTHDMADVEALADDVVIVNKGKVERVWSLRSICRRRRVARFVNSHGPL